MRIISRLSIPKNDIMDTSYPIIIPSVDSEIIEPKIKIYEPDGITYWSREIGFSKLTDSNRKD